MVRNRGRARSFESGHGDIGEGVLRRSLGSKRRKVLASPASRTLGPHPPRGYPSFEGQNRDASTGRASMPFLHLVWFQRSSESTPGGYSASTAGRSVSDMPHELPRDFNSPRLRRCTRARTIPRSCSARGAGRRSPATMRPARSVRRGRGRSSARSHRTRSGGQRKQRSQRPASQRPPPRR